MKKLVLMILILYASIGCELFQKGKIAFAFGSDVGISFNESYISESEHNIPNGIEINTSKRVYPKTGEKQNTHYFKIGIILLVLASLIRLLNFYLKNDRYIKRRKQKGDITYEY